MGIEESNWTWSSRHQFGCLSVALVICLMLAVSLACSLPSLTSSTPEEPTPTLEGITAEPIVSPIPPTPTPPVLPPTLVESDPVPRAEISTWGPITLYFNQEMDRDSVENAIKAQDGLSGEFEWEDSATVTFIPDVPFTPASHLEIILDESVQAANGLSLHERQSLTYEVVGYLQLTQMMPEAGGTDIDPASAIVASFNRPVAPMTGLDDYPPAFWLEPVVEGRGEWFNVSTYIFYPEPALAGGTEYTVYIDPDLTSSYGSPLLEAVSWSFSTLPPKLVSIAPTPGSRSVRLDSRVSLEFNQPMDVESVEANLVLMDPDNQAVPGEFSWNEEFTEVNYKPRYFLKRDLTYTIRLGEGAMTRGGTVLGDQVETSWKTNSPLEVIGTEPSQNGSIDVQDHLILYFTALVQSRNVLQFVSLIPKVDGLNALLADDGRTLHLYGDFTPETVYTLIISPNLPDAWGGRLGEDFRLNFFTQPLEPELLLPFQSDILFLTPEDSSLVVDIINLERISYSMGNVPMEVFTQILSQDERSLLQTYKPEDQRNVEQDLVLPPNQPQKVELPLTVDDEPLQTGLYHLEFNVPAVQYPGGPFLLVVSNVNLTLKIGAKDTMIWAVDLRTNEPISEAAISIYAEDGELLGNGLTDVDGVFKVSIDPLEEDSKTYYAVLDQPGDETFGLVLSSWNQGLEGWNYDLSTDYRPPRLMAYLYSDRSVYQPGETVFFRAIVRQAYNGRYTLPDAIELADGILSLSLNDESGEQISVFNLPLSTYGTAHGSYRLPVGIEPGNYRLVIEEASEASLDLEVVTQRTPGIDLDVSFSLEQALAGQTVQAVVKASYLYGAPVVAAPVRWVLYKEPATIDFPGYQVGALDLGWLNPQPSSQDGSMQAVFMEGEGLTDSDGELVLEFLPTTEDGSYRYILEVMSEDESALWVSATAEVLINQTEHIIGLRPDNLIGQASTSLGFEVRVIDLDRNPLDEFAMRAEFQKVVWERDEIISVGNEGLIPTYHPRFTLVGSTDFVTAPDGVARLSFTPPDPGIYQLDVVELEPESPGTRTQVMIWVGGLGEAEWPDLPNQRLHLISGQDSYLPGETAQVFLSNPFEEGALALVTVERGVVLRHRVLELVGAGTNLFFPLSEEDAPNVIVSVTLLGASPEGRPDYRHGYLNLPVKPRENLIHVELIDFPDVINPGEDLTVGIRVTDDEGNPVVGEFSISIVEQSTQASAHVSTEDILDVFFSNQPLGVRMGIPMSANIHRPVFFDQIDIDDDLDLPVFPPVSRIQPLVPTAYWDAEIITDDQGEAEVIVPLPEELNSWHILVRGLTGDTRVGQAEARLVVTKELLIRPVTPRFLVMGDHTRLTAEVHNNSPQELVVEVNLEAIGFALDDPGAANQSVQIPAGEQIQVFWWGQPQDVDDIDLVFSAKAMLDSENDNQFLEDVARPSLGTIPVNHYVSSQSFASTGMLESSEQQLYLVSLPRSFEARGGELRVELSTSLVASMMSSLEYLENSPSDFTEQILSSFLPNLHVFLALRELGMVTPGLQARLDRTLQVRISELLSRQNSDGGWGWWMGEESDQYISAYVVYGLSQARAAGAPVDGRALQQAVDYLQNTLPTTDMITETWQFDRLAFTHYVISQVGSGDPNGVADLYDINEQLNPGARALLALTLESLSPGDLRAQIILADLSSEAIRSVEGVYWQDHTPDWRNLNTTLQTSATVLYALAQSDTDDFLLKDAIRFLMSYRNASGVWPSTYETAWVLMAQAETLKHVAEPVAEFNFTATLNDTPLASGEAGEAIQLSPVVATRNLRDLIPHSPNTLVIQRDEGSGDLYFSAQLMAERPVESVALLQSGFSLSRQFYPASCEDQVGDARQNCSPITSAKPGDLVNVRLILIIAETSYFVVVEDNIPAGAEILEAQFHIVDSKATNDGDLDQPGGDGAAWRFFSEPQIYDDHITWAAQILSPGTYNLSYKLVILHPGEYGVLPARAWQYYFTEVPSNSAGARFTVDENN
jgi:alpha-2-macroglobulin